MLRKILIIGGVAGGASAATRLRRLDEHAQIIMFERGPHVSFANCGLPYYIGGEIEKRDKLLVQTPEKLHSLFNLDVRVNSEVIGIDREKKEIVVLERLSGKAYRESFDDLLLSTGAAPFVPDIPGIKRPGHFVLRNIVVMDNIDQWIREKDARRAVIVGGGFIGVEVAEQLLRRGLNVSIVESSNHVLAPFDIEMMSLIHEVLRKERIDLYLQNPITQFTDPIDGFSTSVANLKNGEKLPADLVILGLGVRPESKLARDAGLLVGERGGIRVNEYLQTSDPHIWAIGDVIEVRDGVTGQWTLIALAGPANRQGRMVADNILGRKKAYQGTWGTAIIRVFNLTAACTGASESRLKKANIPHQALHIHPNSHAGYFPGAKPMALKILFDPTTGKLLGAQAVGEDGVDKRIDVLATALKAEMTIHDLADLELCYAPPYGSAKDPINLAGMAAENVLSGEIKLVQWHEVASLNQNQFVILDVRDSNERDDGAIPNSKHIPLAELRQRLAELPKDREILAHCQSGQRSYNACRILQQHGFRCRNLTGSYKTWKMGTTA